MVRRSGTIFEVKGNQSHLKSEIGVDRANAGDRKRAEILNTLLNDLTPLPSLAQGNANDAHNLISSDSHDP